MIAVYLSALACYGQIKFQDTIYARCLKEIIFNPIEFKNLSFSVTGADTALVAPSIILIPNDSITKLTVKKGGKVYKEYCFKVIPVPEVEREVWVGEKNTTSKGDIYWVYSVKVFANKKFREEFPKECRYRILEYEVKIIRMGKTIEQKLMTGTTQDVRQDGLKWKDTMVIEIKKVARFNSRNEKEEVNLNNKIIKLKIDDQKNLPTIR